MAIPKKRKKIVSSEEKPVKFKKSSTMAAPKAEAQKTKKAPAGDTRAGRKMEKAFELIEDIDTQKAGPTETSPAQFPDYPPDIDRRTFRFRISLDEPKPGRSVQATTPAPSTKSSALIDIGINIPARVLKIPIIGSAARKVINKITKL